MTKPLTVYKASAGSGKTFTLTVEYIKMLIANPSCYKSILAVTFTNKATEEMKSRILSQLYGIWKRLPDSRSYTDKICADMGIGENMVATRAGTALIQMLHNYNYFRIETIDSFFQSVLRNLARELDLTANLRIELNDKQIEQTVVDDMIDNLRSNDQVLVWIMQYINDNITDDKGWNIIKSIKDFGTNIFKDFYKSNSKALSKALESQEFFNDYTSTLQRLLKVAENNIVNASAAFYSMLCEEDIDETELKSNATSYFKKQKESILPTDDYERSKTYADAHDNVYAWIKKSMKDKSRLEYLKCVTEDSIMPFYNKTENLRKRAWNEYQSSLQILRHMHQLRLLGSIDRMVHESNADNNRFLLSDTQYLLHTLIRDNDTPFIFEKIGTQISNIMIDEFQDTSSVQWQNFKVLLDECLSHAPTGGSMIVGDVKQSIYRWREGDWRLLNDIDKQFSRQTDQLEVRRLQTNYRSESDIIAFNNAFFDAAIKAECANMKDTCPDHIHLLAQAYDDVRQDIPDYKRNPSGRVELTILPSRSDDDDYDSDERMLQITTDTIARLLDNGVSVSDIAILVRSNRSIPPIASYITSHIDGVRVVSDEAYRLDSSIAVNVIIWTLKLLLHPDDEIMQANIASFHARYLSRQQSGSTFINAAWARSLTSRLLLSDSQLTSMPLFEMMEHIQRMFHLCDIEGQSAFLCAFFDQINKYATDNPSDIEGFIEQWDSTICSKTIQADDVEGIRILTIHKSKGLEFDNVIIPYCDWKLSTPDTIWCEPKGEPWDRLPLVPITNSLKKMRGTIFEDDCREEAFQNCVDNMNILYVAFTRASRNLFVIGKHANSQFRSALIEQCLPTVAQSLEGAVLDESDAGGETHFSYGTLSVADHHAANGTSDNVFKADVAKVKLRFKSYASNVEFRQSNDSQEFVKSDDDKQTSYIKTGNLMHSIFANIKTTADIDKVIKDYAERGLLSSTDISASQLRQMIDRRLQNTLAASWFEPGWQIYNECTILSHDPVSGKMKENRPDRVLMRDGHVVVIDFKFGSKKEQHITQVGLYMSLLRQMGWKDVCGYLWYFYTNDIVPVPSSL